jgi:hypothetical protein
VPSWFQFFCSANEQRAIICAKSERRRMVADWVLVGNILFLVLNVASGRAADTTFLGRDSCSSSGCHGGAGARQNQSLIWSRQDPHARASATLTSARSRRIAQVLKISDATRDRSCTSCHSPWQGLAAELLPDGGKVFNVHAEAVSCETCHGAAADWIRSHTRPDLTRAEKVLDGLRDLTMFYNRANACVACHQVLDPKLLAAGHPELIFELDGQTSAMPRHWIEKDEQYRQKGWLTGQAAALREVTAQIVEQRKAGEIATHTLNQWQSLLWVVSRAMPEHKISKIATNSVTTTNSFPGSERLRELHQLADALAIEASVRVRDESITLLSRLAGTGSEFANAEGDRVVHAIRAERLALALDRLSHTLPAAARKNLDEPLRAVFALVQSRPDFNAKEFARSLEQFKILLDNVSKARLN